MYYSLRDKAKEERRKIASSAVLKRHSVLKCGYPVCNFFLLQMLMSVFFNFMTAMSTEFASITLEASPASASQALVAMVATAQVTDINFVFSPETV